MNLQGADIPYKDGYVENQFCSSKCEYCINARDDRIQTRAVVLAKTLGPQLHKDDLVLVDGPYAGRAIRYPDARQGYSLHFPLISGGDAIYAVATQLGVLGNPPGLFYVHTQPAPVRTEREQRIDAMWSDELVAAVDGKPHRPKFAVAMRDDYVNILGLTRDEYYAIASSLWATPQSLAEEDVRVGLWAKLTANEVEL